MTPSIDDDAGALGNLLAHVPEILLLIDTKRRIRYINRVEPGFDRRNVIGAPVSMFVFPDSQEVLEAALSVSNSRRIASSSFGSCCRSAHGAAGFGTRKAAGICSKIIWPRPSARA